jgi:hypothetical protein
MPGRSTRIAYNAAQAAKRTREALPLNSHSLPSPFTAPIRPPGTHLLLFFFSLLPYKAKKLMRFWAFGEFTPKHQ